MPQALVAPSRLILHRHTPQGLAGSCEGQEGDGEGRVMVLAGLTAVGVSLTKGECQAKRKSDGRNWVWESDEARFSGGLANGEPSVPEAWHINREAASQE